MPFLKAELRRLAEFGARRELAQMEYKIHLYQREFPDLFVSDERVILLKAELRGRTQQDDSKPMRSAAYAASWTPERRAIASRLMRARQTELKKARGITPKRKTATKKAKTKTKKAKRVVAQKGRGLKDLWYERLLSHGPEAVGLSTKALGKKHSASLLSSAEEYIKRGVIKKTGKGIYGVGGTAPETT